MPGKSLDEIRTEKRMRPTVYVFNKHQRGPRTGIGDTNESVEFSVPDARRPRKMTVYKALGSTSVFPQQIERLRLGDSFAEVLTVFDQVAVADGWVSIYVVVDS